MMMATIYVAVVLGFIGTVAYTGDNTKDWAYDQTARAEMYAPMIFRTEEF